MQVVLYFKSTEPPTEEQSNRLRIEILGDPDKVERLVHVIREEIKKWFDWMES